MKQKMIAAETAGQNQSTDTISERFKQNGRVIVHIPHSSTKIPAAFRSEFTVSDETVRHELLCMTDWYTEELFRCEGCQTVVHRYSRLICDPERFLDPEEEGMWEKGMGMYYTRTSDGIRLKRSPLSSAEGLSAYGRALQIYQQHHRRLAGAVQARLEACDSALLVDGHSFPSTALSYEFQKNFQTRRPDICLGTDAVFTPRALLEDAKAYFLRAGLEVAVNTPFAGTLVPEPFYSSRDRRVQSLMIEVNRRLYMDETNAAKKETFGAVKELVQGFLKLANEGFR